MSTYKDPQNLGSVPRARPGVMEETRVAPLPLG